ncbi:LysR family transcriptional regulator [Mangrovihabitans endophyticus]|nr:LysR substrate-binding domain-containing protein [Mangrovihabitans endophyticus]
MDVQQLRMLRALGALGSVSAVAESLRITPSAVSQQLRLLQRGTPVPLTRRERRRLVLTEAGRRVAAAAVQVEAALTVADETVRSLAASTRGTVSVAAFSSAALAFFPALVQDFPPDGPVSVSLADEDRPQTEFPRLTSRYDVVLAHRFEHTPHWPDTVSVTPLLEEPLDVAMPAGSPLAGKATLDAADVAGHPWITTHEGFPVGAIVDALAAVSGHPVRVRHRVNEFTVVAAMVRAGAGLALLPRWTIPPTPGVVLRPLGGVRAVRRIDALCRPENVARPAVVSTLDVLHRIAAAIHRRPQR